MSNPLRLLVVTTILGLLASLLGCAGYGTSVHMHERDGIYVLHVPASSLQVLIPRNGFVQKDARQVGGPDHPWYFYFEDSARNTIISGWFEAEKAFPGIRRLWEEDTRVWEKEGLPTPADVAFTKIGNWDAVFYDLPHSDYTDSHLMAHWIQAGTWIELHLSITTKAPSSSARSALVDKLHTIRIAKY